MTNLEVARGFIDAVQERDADAAAELCTELVEVALPGADAPLRGKEGVRQMIRMAPQFLQSIRDEEERDGEVRITTLTRAPGVFANYTTWLFAINGGKVDRLSFRAPRRELNQGLGGCDEADADGRATARTVEGRERRLSLSQRWNEPQTVSVGHAPLALGASQLTTSQLGMCRL